LIAEFYLVDRGLRHRLPGFSSLGRLGVLPQGLRRFRYQWAHCGSWPTGRIPDQRGWFDRNCPHRARSLLGDHKLEEPSRELPTGLGIDPRDSVPTTTSSKSVGGSFTITVSRSFCRPRPIWIPKDRSGTHLCGVAICPGAMRGIAILPFGITGCQVTSLAGQMSETERGFFTLREAEQQSGRWDTVSPKKSRHCSWPPAMKAVDLPPVIEGHKPICTPTRAAC
jgi:hypothetical protein